MSRLRLMGLYALLFIPHLLCAQHSDIIAIKNALPQITDSVGYADALNRLSSLYLPRQLDSSGVYARRAKELSERIRYNKGQSDALRAMGRYYALRPHRYLSFLFYDNALVACRAAGDSAGVTVSLMNIGTFYQYQQKHAEAQSYINRALKVAWDMRLDSLRIWVLASYYLINESDSVALPIAQKGLQHLCTLACYLCYRNRSR